MTEFDKNLKLWIIDDLAKRRDSHAAIIKDNLPQAQIFKVAHPLHLEQLIMENLNEAKTAHNIFFSDYNMRWQNVEWTKDLASIDAIKPDSSFDDFPGTQKILKKFQKDIPNFLLIMLSTMVLEQNYPSQRQGDYKETSENSWEYEDLPISSIDLEKIHKLSKPFTKDKLENTLNHYRFLIA